MAYSDNRLITVFNYSYRQPPLQTQTRGELLARLWSRMRSGPLTGLLVPQLSESYAETH